MKMKEQEKNLDEQKNFPINFKDPKIFLCIRKCIAASAASPKRTGLKKNKIQKNRGLENEKVSFFYVDGDESFLCIF